MIANPPKRLAGRKRHIRRGRMTYPTGRIYLVCVRRIRLMLKSKEGSDVVCVALDVNKGGITDRSNPFSTKK